MNDAAVGALLIFGMVAAAGAGRLIGLRSGRNATKKWSQIPTILEYRLAYPQLSLPGAVKCRNAGCGSTKFNNFGWTASNDRRRIIRCAACSTKLYRDFVD